MELVRMLMNGMCMNEMTTAKLQDFHHMDMNFADKWHQKEI